MVKLGKKNVVADSVEGFFSIKKVQTGAVLFTYQEWRGSTWSWPSGWCIGLRSWLRGFDAQLGHLHDACTSLPQKF